jgi:hypothetical protein
MRIKSRERVRVGQHVTTTKRAFTREAPLMPPPAPWAFELLAAWSAAVGVGVEEKEEEEAAMRAA